MRNGNLTHSGIYCTSLPGSYPTYEEWKPSSKCFGFIKIPGSYPTYEEWKPIDAKVIIAHLKSSYPTYEEWKQTLKKEIKIVEKPGSYPTYEEWKLCKGIDRCVYGNQVLILPMRNGNFQDFYNPIVNITFLSYL